MPRKIFSAILYLLFGLAAWAINPASAADKVQVAGKGNNCTAAQGQIYIDEARYDDAIREFTCLIDAQPAEVEGYRGRIEARVLLGEYSNAVRDYNRVTTLVLPAHPDAQSAILAGYDERLAAAPNSIPALTGASFARWWFFQYPPAIQLLNRLLALAPNDVYGSLFRGSSRFLSGGTPAQATADLERAIQLAPSSPDVRFIVADAYTYGRPDPNRALIEASLALNWGLDTPRIHAILGAAYQALGNTAAAAVEVQTHINQVTAQLVETAPLNPGGSLTLGLAPGRTYEIPVSVTAGQTLSIGTGSRDFFDTILVLLAPGGLPVVSSDDYVKYFAGLDWVAGTTATYRMQVTSFESVSTGELVVTRK